MRSVRIDGDRATATVIGGPNAVRLSRDGDDWLIDEQFARGWRALGLPGNRPPPGVPPLGPEPHGTGCDGGSAANDCG